MATSQDVILGDLLHLGKNGQAKCKHLSFKPVCMLAASALFFIGLNTGRYGSLRNCQSTCKVPGLWRHSFFFPTTIYKGGLPSQLTEAGEGEL